MPSPQTVDIFDPALPRFASLFDHEPLHGRLHFGQLGERQAQDAVGVLGLDAVLVDAADVKGALILAVGPLAADVGPLLVLLLMLAVALRTDGKGVLAEVDVDAVLVKAGQIRLQQVAVPLVGDRYCRRCWWC